MKKVKYSVKGMHCKSCANIIEKNLESESGVSGAKASFDTKKMVVIFDERKTNEARISEVIDKSGDYAAELLIEGDSFKEKEKLSDQENSEPKKKIISGGFMALLIISFALNIYFIRNYPSLVLREGSGAIKEVVAQDNNDGKNDAQIKAINFNITEADLVRGNFDAPVTLVEFSDFQCPFSLRVQSVISKALTDYPDQVRVIFKHFPLDFHQYSQKAAEASECASEQGKFWEYHDKLFQNQNDFSLDNFKKWAEELSLNVIQFNSCIDSSKYAAKVQNDFQEGLKNKVNGTPTTFINDSPIVGAQSYETFKQAIDKVLSQK